MQKTKLLPVVAVATFFGATTLLQSCDKVENASVDLPAMTATVDVTVPPTSNTTAQQDMGTQSISYNVDSFIKANTNGTLGVNNIKAVSLKSCVVKLRDGSDADNNFANFETVTASMSTDNVTKEQTMTVSMPDKEAYDATLSVPTEDLSPYLKSTSIKYKVSGKLRREIKKEVKATVTIQYVITAKRG